MQVAEVHPRNRRIVAALGLSVPFALVTSEIVRRGRAGRFELLAASAFLVAAALPLHPALLAQIGATAAAAFVACVAGLVIARGHAPLEVIAMGCGAVLALVAQRGAFTTKAATSAFAPVRARGGFLVACVALAAVGALLGILMLEAYDHHHRRAALASAVVLVLVATALVGIVRMRAWGVFAAALASIAGAGAFAAITAVGDRGRHALGFWWGAYETRPFLVGWALAACAGALAVAPVIWARWIRPSA